MNNPTNKRQRTRTRVSERVTPSKSEETIIDLLIMSISCITFLRGFFTDKYFTDDILEINKNILSQQSSYSTQKESIKIKRLAPGISDVSDKILNWIKISIFDALHKKYLKAINFSIILDKENPNNIFETYCFEIDYLDSTETINFNGVLISPNELTKIQIFKLLKKFIILTQSLPPLPIERFVFMRLLCNDRCPNDYFINNFNNCSNEKSAIMKIPQSIQNNFILNCGDVNSVHHKLSTSLISLTNIDNKNNQDNILEIDPFDLFYKNKKLPETDSQFSQISKNLYDVIKFQNNELHDGFTQLPNSIDYENISKIECICKSSSYLAYSSIIKCSKCFKSMHKVCFSINFESTHFICHNCNDKKINLNFSDMFIIFNIRKLLAYLNFNKKNSLKSITDTASILGYNEENLNSDKFIIKSIVNVFSILIFEGILSLKSQKSFSHNIFKVDVDGLLKNNNTVKKGKYFISFIPKNNQNKISKLIDPNFEISNKIDSIVENLDEQDNPYSNDEDETYSYNKRNKPSSDIFKF